MPVISDEFSNMPWSGQRKMLARRRRDKLCLKCGKKKAEGFVHCAPCHKKTMERQREAKGYVKRYRNAEGNKLLKRPRRKKAV